MLCAGCCWWCCCCWFSAAILHIVAANCGKKPTQIAKNWPIDELKEGDTLAVHTVASNYSKLLPFVMRHRAPIFIQTLRPNQPPDRPTHNTLKWSGQSPRANHHVYTHNTRAAFLGFKTQISPLPWEINKCDKALYHANS